MTQKSTEVVYFAAEAWNKVCTHVHGGTQWRSLLRHWATSLKVADSVPDGVTAIFHWHNPSGRTMVLGLTQLLTEMCKGKGTPNRTEGQEGLELYPYSFFTSALEAGGWSAPRPGRFTSGKHPLPIAQEAGWAPGPVWTCEKSRPPTGIRSPDRPARSQS
jgi:hypothetical protein